MKLPGLSALSLAAVSLVALCLPAGSALTAPPARAGQPENGPETESRSEGSERSVLTDPHIVYDHEYHYRWSLGGLMGFVGRLFLPGHGEGVMSYHRLEDGRVKTELLITSEAAENGEYWQYGSEIDPDTGDSVEAWSSYRWRGEEKSKHQEVEEEGVKDIVAGILSLRLDPPAGPRRMEVWSDGKTYPVLVIPRKKDTREVGEQEVLARHYEVRGLDVPGRRRWKGSMDVWLAEDEAATPVEIHLERSLAKLRLRLVEMPRP